MVANKGSISGTGSISGIGNLNGEAISFLHSFTLTDTTYWSTGDFLFNSPLSDPLDGWITGTIKNVTISGLDGPRAYANGETINILFASQLQMVTTDTPSQLFIETLYGTAAAYDTGNVTTDLPGFTINWN